ncbi:MAG: DUF58 domain-containing protein [Nitrospinae bacterium]|nr:DUF58 domain-containing protein [Nitrospinota bacterium]
MFQTISKNIRDWFSIPAPPPKRENQLSPELLQRIKTLQVKTNYLVNDIMAGEYVSAFKGRGMEFSEVREYQPGDDVRLIDWNVTARMNQPFIKEFIEERELTLMLLVDVSSSGVFGSGQNFKNEVAAEVASILAFAAIKNNDKIGLIIFTDQIEHYIPPKKGKGHIWNIIRTILSFKPEGKATNLSLPLEYLLKIQKKKATAFLISDFQDEKYESQLKLAKQRFDLIAINIIDPREESLPEVGMVYLEDAETGDTLLVDTGDAEMIKKHKSLCIKKRQDRKTFFHSIGIDTIEIFTDKPLTEPIIKYFKLREKKH